MKYLRKNWRPREIVRPLTWFCGNIQTHDGRPYDHDAYPHIGAPGGPCDVLTDDSVKTIWLQWASRLGKSFFAQCAMMFYAFCHACPMMLASADEKLAIEVATRTYAMIDRCRVLRRRVPVKHKRRTDRIDFDNCRTNVAWARSPSTLADKPVKFGHANEIDKWVHQSTSKEGDPLKLYDERFKEYHYSKSIKESTPTVKGRSRIEHGRIGSTNCKYYVPCPHCGRYQVLVMERVRYDKDANGRSDKDIARRTARYECLHCDGHILDHHRSGMMRAGVWVPEGCGVDDVEAAKAAALWSGAKGGDGAGLWEGWETAKWITGLPARNGPDAGYQLSSLYALSLTWGTIAAEYVECKAKPGLLRGFINGWLGETWEIKAKKQSWEQLGEKIIVHIPQAVAPAWSSLLTAAVDKQIDHYKFCVKAWGPNRSNHTLDYGTFEDLQDLVERVLKRKFPIDGRIGELRVKCTLIDSGFRPKGIYEFCKDAKKRGYKVLPCKGSNESLGTPYRLKVLGKDTGAPGQKIVHVDTLTTQDWIENLLFTLSPSDPGGGSLFEGSLAEHQDYLEQLLNDAAILGLDARNYEKEVWQRIDDTIPNDYRDTERYAYVAMLLETRNAPIRAAVEPATEGTPTPKKRPPRPTQQSPFSFLERPGGWAADFRR